MFPIMYMRVDGLVHDVLNGQTPFTKTSQVSSNTAQGRALCSHTAAKNDGCHANTMMLTTASGAKQTTT